MSEAQNSPDYYENRGISRQGILLSKDHADRLKEIAKLHKINTGEVIEVLLDNMEPAILISKFEAKRNERLKKDGRVAKGELTKKMKEATPEQLAEIQRILGR
jgi:TusA-related sulfurtransferase